jgi:diphosphomevalonate decarboxylase
MNLSGSYTTTTVEFSSDYSKDDVELVDGNFSEGEIQRVVKSLDLIRKRAEIQKYARVVTKNTFPKGAGAAASASGFAALTVAGFAAAGVSLSEKELTIFARLGSGSACRSIPDGFALWTEGESSEESFAYSLYPSTYWDIRDILVIVDSSMKEVSTTKGMEDVHTSPLLASRLAALPGRIKRVQQALADKSFSSLGEVVEEDCLDMHAVMQSQHPPLMY